MSSLTHPGFALDRENISYSVFPFLLNCKFSHHLIFHLLYARHLRTLYELRYPLSQAYLCQMFFFKSVFWKSRFVHCSEITSALLYFKISSPADKLVKLYQNLWLCVNWPRESRGMNVKSSVLLTVLGLILVFLV